MFYVLSLLTFILFSSPNHSLLFRVVPAEYEQASERVSLCIVTVDQKNACVYCNNESDMCLWSDFLKYSFI